MFAEVTNMFGKPHGRPLVRQTQVVTKVQDDIRGVRTILLFPESPITQHRLKEYTTQVINETDETGFGPAKGLLAIYMLFDLMIFECIDCI